MAWADENILQQWRDANIITIYKNKGDKSICGKNRGISLLAIAGKVLAMVMLQKLITTSLSQYYLNHSTGLGRTGARSISFLQHGNFSKSAANNTSLDLFVVLINLSKAFDTVSRKLLWEVLIKLGCTAKFVRILCQFCQEFAPFPVCRAIRQGSVLAPVLFNIFLLCVTQLFHKDLKESTGIAVDFRLISGGSTGPSMHPWCGH